MKAEILSLLKNTTEYVSGQELCERFGVSRNAVWKAVESLKKDGYVIEAVRNRGYRLVDDGRDVFCQRELDSELSGNSLIRKAVFFDEIGSTNTEAKKLAEEGEAEGLLLVSDRQTAGRGRRGRSWISPAGKNAYYTLMLRPSFSPEKAPMLTLVMALAVTSALVHMADNEKESESEGTAISKNGSRIKIKWPNDVIIDGRKICGILTEMSAEKDYIHYVVIGVGINVKVQEFDPEIADRAGSIEQSLNIPVKRCELIGSILKFFNEYYEIFKKCEDLSGLKDIYEGYLVNKDCEVRVLDPKGEFCGKALGIDNEGELIVEKEDGETVKVYAGEVSVRGIYGYT